MPKAIRSIRIDAEILAALEAQAKKDRRSVNNLIEMILSTHLDVSEGWLE